MPKPALGRQGAKTPGVFRMIGKQAQKASTSGNIEDFLKGAQNVAQSPGTKRILSPGKEEAPSKFSKTSDNNQDESNQKTPDEQQDLVQSPNQESTKQGPVHAQTGEQDSEYQATTEKKIDFSTLRSTIHDIRKACAEQNVPESVEAIIKKAEKIANSLWGNATDNKGSRRSEETKEKWKKRIKECKDIALYARKSDRKKPTQEPELTTPKKKIS